MVRRLAQALLIQRDEFGVRECQFHLPPAISFIRMYDITAGHGEDLSSFRPMILAVNHDKEPQRGIEIGRRGLSIRGIYPLEDAKGHIGSVEIGMSFSPVLNETKATTGYDVAVFVSDPLMTKVATLIPRPDAERIVGDMQMTEATNWAFLKPLVSASLLAQGRDVAFETPTVNDIPYGIVLVPMLDYKGQNIGVLVAARSFEEYRTQARWALTRSLAMAGLQIILLAGVLLLVVNAMLLKPLMEIAKIGVANEDEAEKATLATYAARPDEIGTIAKLLQHCKAESRSGDDSNA
jgi:methyl-accepting chemotaxis protein